ncbi:hypothetical protein AAHC03_024474 [Spirometra sp. Aus1]
MTSILSKSTLTSSSTTSQQSFSVAAPDEADSDRALSSRESQWSRVSASSPSASSTQSRQRVHSTQQQFPPIASSTPTSEAVGAAASSCFLSQADSHAPSQGERPGQPQGPPLSSHSTLSTLEKTFSWGLTLLSDVAFQASCLPLSLLCRLITGGMSTSFRLSSRAASPRSFTIFIAYVVLTFLAISMAYLYYRIETFPMDASVLLSSAARRSGNHLRTTATAMCGQEFKEVASALTRLSELSDRVQRLTESIKAMSTARSTFEPQEGLA